MSEKRPRLQCRIETLQMEPWEGSFRGLRWVHMPGQDEVNKKLNFALWRRGLVKLDTITGEDLEERRARGLPLVSNPLQRCNNINLKRRRKL